MTLLIATFLFMLSASITSRNGGQSSAFTARNRRQVPSLSSSTTTTTLKVSDTPEILPEFETDDDYLDYMKTVSNLPKGFATGTSDGTFISCEAPGLGSLKIRATVIHLTEGPTDSWAACFTSNKVKYIIVFWNQRRTRSLYSSLSLSFLSSSLLTMNVS